MRREFATLPIEELELSAHTYNCLKRQRIDTVGTIVALGEDGLLAVRNLSERDVREIRDSLRQRFHTDLDRLDHPDQP